MRKQVWDSTLEGRTLAPLDRRMFKNVNISLIVIVELYQLTTNCLHGSGQPIENSSETI